MRKDFGVKTWLFPQPVMILATYDENGVPNAMNAAWGGICDYDKVVVDLGSHKTTDNLKVNPAFTLAFADAAHTAACDYLGMVSGRDVPNKLEIAGFTAVKSSFVNAPILTELPVTLECELLKTEEDGRMIGRIVNVSCDEAVLGEDGLPDLKLFTPITFDPVHNTYVALGKVTGSAFSDGKRYME